MSPFALNSAAAAGPIISTLPTKRKGISLKLCETEFFFSRQNAGRRRFEIGLTGRHWSVFPRVIFLTA